jgi:hypothetical protein
MREEPYRTSVARLADGAAIRDRLADRFGLSSDRDGKWIERSRDVGGSSVSFSSARWPLRRTKRMTGHPTQGTRCVATIVTSQQSEQRGRSQSERCSSDVEPSAVRTVEDPLRFLLNGFPFHLRGMRREPCRAAAVTISTPTGHWVLRLTVIAVIADLPFRTGAPSGYE